MSRDPSLWPPLPDGPVKRRPPSKRRRIDCMDCGIDTSLAGGNSHYYTMRDAVWQWHRERAEMMAENTKGNRR